MTDTQAILARCRELGARLMPTPHGTLRVKAPAPIPDSLRSELRRHKEEIIGLLREPAPTGDWPCLNCGNRACIEDVFPSLDGERMLTMWSCNPCQVVAVTPSDIKEPPSGWVKRTPQ